MISDVQVYIIHIYFIQMNLILVSGLLLSFHVTSLTSLLHSNFIPFWDHAKFIITTHHC